jgi:hypothetical protein
VDSFVLTFPNEKQHLSKPVVNKGSSSPSDLKERKGQEKAHKAMQRDLDRELSLSAGREDEQNKELFKGIVPMSVFRQVAKANTNKIRNQRSGNNSRILSNGSASALDVSQHASLPTLGAPQSSVPPSREAPLTSDESNVVVDMKLKTHTETIVQCTMSVYIGTASNGFEKTLLADICGISDESIVMVGVVLPVKLPSIALVDRETAVSFAENVADLLAIRYTDNSDSRAVSPMTTKMSHGSQLQRGLSSGDCLVSYLDPEVFMHYDD